MKSALLSKTISLVVIFAMLLFMVSCYKKSPGKKTRKIAADDPWFDAKVYNIEPDLDSEGKIIEYKQQKLAGADDKYIVVYSNGYYVRPDNNVDYNSRDYSFYLVTIVDRNNGDKLRTIDLNQYLSDEGFVFDVEYFNGKVTSTIYNFVGYSQVICEVDNDILTGKKLAERNLGENDGTGEKIRFNVGKYKVQAESIYDNTSQDPYYFLKIFSPEGEEFNVELRKDCTGLLYIPIIVPLDDARILVPVTQTTTNIPVYFEIDIKAEKAIEVDGNDYDWIDFKSITNGYVGNNGNVYFATSVGISSIDMQNKTIEEFFPFDMCQINYERLGNSEIAYCSDDCIVLLGGRVSSFSLVDSSKMDFDVFVITKASENPNAGKTVLELYATNGSVDQTIAEAIFRFNEINKDYFIEVTDRYKVDDIYNILQTDSLDDGTSRRLQNNLSLNDKLAMDIMNGSGPDILIITDDMGRLNNPNNLADLSQYLGDLDSGKYFINVINAAKTDDKLYQLPITFGITGIHTDSEYAGKSGLGFTTKEYEGFLYGPLNGYDLDQSGQAFYFANLFNAMRDKFIINGKVDFSGPEFAELAEFVKNNVREKAPAMDSEELSDERKYQNDRIARLTNYGFITRYLEGVNDLQGARTILGIPSADGRGPMLCAGISVAVSSQAVSIDACAEFAKLLLEDEIQIDLAKSNHFTVNREAYKKVSDLVIDYCNSPRGSREFEFNTITFEPIKNRIKFTDDDLAYLENIILNCSHFNSTDASIDLILIEEMPPYFLGQKDLNSVIMITQDRIQKVLDERG